MSKPIDPKRWSQGRVYALRRWTDTLFSVQVEAEVQPFLAGQFTKLGLQLDAEFVERPYSYVNAPQEMPLEFYFVTVPDGPLTRAMTVLQPGDPIWVTRDAHGFLRVGELDVRDHDARVRIRRLWRGGRQRQPEHHGRPERRGGSDLHGHGAAAVGVAPGGACASAERRRSPRLTIRPPRR